MNFNFKALTASEQAVVEWQYRLAGDFKTALWQAIARADEGNLARLRLGFPDDVAGFLAFSREKGWWERVQQKVCSQEAT